MVAIGAATNLAVKVLFTKMYSRTQSLILGTRLATHASLPLMLMKCIFMPYSFVM